MTLRLPASSYTYSDPVNIKKWSGGEMWIQVGYVKDHPKHNQIVLFKRYPIATNQQKTDKYYLKCEDWPRLRSAVEKLLPDLENGDVSQAAIDAAVKRVSEETQLLDLLVKYPYILSNLPDDIDIFTLPTEQKDALKRLLNAGGQVAQNVITKLAKQPVRDLQDFDKILEELRLSTVNSLITHVSSRLSFINAFETAIHDNATYERRGSSSVHNLLRANIWILNNNYTILHDDETLKNIIQQQFNSVALDDEASDRRPDFLCLASRRIDERYIDQLVVIEIKRPSVTLTMNHMQQLMGYRDVLARHSGATIKNFKCYLIGRQKDRLLLSNDLSSSGFIARTYTDFIGEARQFYQEYLDIIQKDELAL